MAIPPAGEFDRHRLRSLRQGRALTQEALAELVRASAYTVHEWETGKSRPSVESLRELAKTLGVPVADLYRPPGGATAYLKDLRVLAGLTQVELVRELNKLVSPPGVTQSKISNWERAKSQIPEEFAVPYAEVLGVSAVQLDEAARVTWQDGRRASSWTPSIDQRQREFKGLAAGSRELEFVYRLASDLFDLTELVVSRAATLNAETAPFSAEELHFWHVVTRYHYKFQKELRQRAVEIINRRSGLDEDVAERARSVIWTLDQHLTISEDLLGLPREKLALPHGMLGNVNGEPLKGKST